MAKFRLGQCNRNYSSLTVNNGRATSATVSDGSLKLVITFDQVQ